MQDLPSNQPIPPPFPGPQQLPPIPPFPSNQQAGGANQPGFPSRPLPIPPGAPGGAPIQQQVPAGGLPPAALQPPAPDPNAPPPKPSAGMPDPTKVTKDMKKKPESVISRLFRDNKVLLAGAGVALIGIVGVAILIPGPHTLLLLGAVCLVVVGVGIMAASPFLEKPVGKVVDYGAEKIKHGVELAWENAKPAAKEIKDSAKKTARKGVEVAKAAVHSVQVQKLRTAMANFLTDTVAGSVAPSLHLDPTDRKGADKGDDVKEESLLDSLKAEAKKAVKEGETELKDFGEGVSKTLENVPSIVNSAIKSVKESAVKFKTTGTKILGKIADRVYLDSLKEVNKQVRTAKSEINDQK